MSIRQVPKIGLVFLSHPYLVGKQKLEKYRKSVEQSLTKINIEYPVNEVIETAKDSHKVREIINRSDICLVVLFFSSWVREELPLFLAKNVNLPFLLWAISGNVGSLPLSGIVSTASDFLRIDRQFTWVVGDPHHSEVMSEIKSWADACQVYRDLQGTRIGVIGQGCPGMIDAEHSEIELIKMGVEVVRLDLSDVLKGYQETSEDQARNVLSRVKVYASEREDPYVSEKDLLNSSKLYLALREIVERENLDALADIILKGNT